MITEKEQKIVDAVNFFEGEWIGDWGGDYKNLEIVGEKYRFFTCGRNRYIENFVCTIEEFNQCVKEMSQVAGVDAFIENQCKKIPIKPFLQTGEAFEHTKTLNFIRERMINTHGENSNYDYMHKLTNAIIFMESIEEQPKKTKMSKEKRWIVYDENGLYAGRYNENPSLKYPDNYQLFEIEVNI